MLILFFCYFSLKKNPAERADLQSLKVSQISKYFCTYEGLSLEIKIVFSFYSISLRGVKKTDVVYFIECLLHKHNFSLVCSCN